MNLYIILAVLIILIAIVFFTVVERKEEYTERVMLPPVPRSPNSETIDALAWQLGGY